MGYGSLANGADLRSPNSRRLGGELNVVLTFDVDEFEDRSVWASRARGLSRLATAICLPTPALPAIGHSLNRARMLTTTVR
jgi:hypothetical protein